MYKSKMDQLFNRLITQVSWEHQQQIAWQLDDEEGNWRHKKYGNFNNFLDGTPQYHSHYPSRSHYPTKKPIEKTDKKCPKCNGYLVKRKGPYGEFLGCQNYPKCSYKINIKKQNPEPNQVNDKDAIFIKTNNSNIPIKLTPDSLHGTIVYNSYSIKDFLKQLGASYLSNLKAWRVYSFTPQEMKTKIEKYLNKGNN